MQGIPPNIHIPAFSVSRRPSVAFQGPRFSELNLRFVSCEPLAELLSRPSQSLNPLSLQPSLSRRLVYRVGHTVLMSKNLVWSTTRMQAAVVEQEEMKVKHLVVEEESESYESKFERI